MCHDRLLPGDSMTERVERRGRKPWQRPVLRSSAQDKRTMKWDEELPSSDGVSVSRRKGLKKRTKSVKSWQSLHAAAPCVCMHRVYCYENCSTIRPWFGHACARPTSAAPCTDRVGFAVIPDSRHVRLVRLVSAGNGGIKGQRGVRVQSLTE